MHTLTFLRRVALCALLLGRLDALAQTNYNAGGGSGTGGNYNVFVGPGAGRITTGSGNSFVGSLAGYSNTSGSSNVFVGNEAGRSNSTSSYNTFVGNQAGFRNTTGLNNTMLGAASGVYNTTGQGNLFAGQRSGLGNATGSGNSYVGYLTNSPSSVVINNSSAIGNRAYVSKSNSLVLGSIAGLNGASNSVNVGIGVHAPAYKLHLSANSAAKPGSSAWTVASDKRLKSNVQDFTDGLNVLLQVNPVKYRYNGKAEMPTDKEYVGIIAQEMKEVAPYMVGEFVYQDTTGKQERYLDYDASALTYVIVNSVKEQQKTMEALQQENQQLKQENQVIKQQLARIEQLLAQQLPNLEGNSAARLWQNAPNPYDRTTTIKYFVPESVSSARIEVFNTAGQAVGSYPLSNRGAGELTLQAGQLAAGTYLYKLLVDGVSIDSKKLVIVK